MTKSASVQLHSTLYRQITGETPSDLKRSQQLAHLIEEQIIANGWKSGQRLGAETDVAERFQVGRASAREAIRILQLRGTIRSQRGPGGGLEVATLAREDVLRATFNFFQTSGLDLDTFLEARHSLDVIAAMMAAEYQSHPLNGHWPNAADTLCASDFRAYIASRGNNVAMLLLHDCNERLGEYFGVRDRDTLLSATLQARVCAAIQRGDVDAASKEMTAWCNEVQHSIRTTETPCQQEKLSQTNWISLKNQTRAEIIAAKIASDIRTRLREGDLIGNEFALQEQYDVGRVVMRQAIRLVEESGLAVTARGRGRGLIVSQPSSGPTTRLLCAYLSQQSAPLHDIWSLMRLLHVKHAQLAAYKAILVEREKLKLVADSLLTWSGPFETLPIAEAETAVTRLSHNELLEVFIKVMQVYCMWTAARARGWLSFNRTGMHEYRDYARAVLEWIREGDNRSAAQAEWSKHEFLANKVWSAEI